MTKLKRLSRDAEKIGDKIIVKTEQEEEMTIDEFNEHLINTFNEKEKMRVELDVLKAKIDRLAKEVKVTKELEDFSKKLKEVEKLKDKEKCIEVAKKFEELVNNLEKDLINLRTIQEKLKGGELK